REFIEGIPQFTVSIGFAVEGRPAVGVVFNPAVNKLYKGGQGAGAMLNGRPIQVTQREQVEGASLIVSRSEPRKRFQQFEAMCKVQSVGSIAYRLAVIGGAGGVVIDGEGLPVRFNRKDSLCRGLVAANPMLAKSLHVMLSKALAENF